jgi:hypothetical protein
MRNKLAVGELRCHPEIFVPATKELHFFDKQLTSPIPGSDELDQYSKFFLNEGVKKDPIWLISTKPLLMIWKPTKKRLV